MTIAREKELATVVAHARAHDVVDKLNGVTVSGITLADEYFKVWGAAGYDVADIAAALRHWVVAAGYNEEGEFEIIISNHILNT